jgi:hypothetical protein
VTDACLTARDTDNWSFFGTCREAHHDRALADMLSFRRIADIPFDARMAVLDSWQRTRHDGELRLGNSLLRGPAGRDHHLGTCRIEVQPARGPLRSPVRMRLDIEPWSPITALDLIPRQRVRPSTAYLAGGHRLLDSLTRTLPVHAPAQQHPDQGHLRAALSAGGLALSRP